MLLTWRSTRRLTNTSRRFPSRSASGSPDAEGDRCEPEGRPLSDPLGASDVEPGENARVLSQAASKHVTFGFWHGASIEDPSGRLESSGEVMAHVKLREKSDIDARLFASWLKQARAIESSG
jgi:hypothetical protein